MAKEGVVYRVVAPFRLYGVDGCEVIEVQASNGSEAIVRARGDMESRASRACWAAGLSSHGYHARKGWSAKTLKSGGV